MKTRELYNRTVNRFRAAGIADAGLEAELLLRFFLDLDRIGLFLDEHHMSAPELERFEELLSRRLTREPLSYITGEKEFWSLSFEVSPAVLIPRSETELLVEHVLKLVENPESYSGTILDLGTGSGVIAIVLALELPRAGLVALDRSGAALAVAARNVRRHRLADRVALIKGDWLSPFRPAAKFDLIVSNPPYVASAIRHGLQPELAFEPGEALYAGPDGMAAYRGLIPLCRQHLKAGGQVLFEIGADQEKMVSDLFQASPGLELCGISQDYSGHARIVRATAVDGPAVRR